MIYLDNAATTARKPIGVYRALMWETLFHSSNAGRGTHRESLRATEAIINAQDEIGMLFNIKKPQNIVFTQNATYALNLAILGTLGNGGHAIVTQMDHNSVLRPVYRLGNYTVVNADTDGYVCVKDIERAIRPDTKMIIMSHASNVCGTVQNIGAVSQLAKSNGIMFMIDAAQTAGVVPIDNEILGADFIACAGHKGLMGPLGTGCLYVHSPRKLIPVITGGTGSNSELKEQPRNMPEMLHSGTMNTPAISALAEGVKFVRNHGADEIGAYESELANELRNRLANMSHVKIYGSPPQIGTVAFNIKGMGSDEAAAKLTGFALRAGFHCAPLAHEALKTQKTGAVRASFGYFNKKSDAVKLADAIYKIIA